MTGFRDVFERHEKKYCLTTEQYRSFAQSAAAHMQSDEYATSKIYSLYYDTPQAELINRSLEAPLYKEKFRMRAYGVPTDDGLVFLEIKKKFKGVVYKRRVGCSYAAAKAYMRGAGYEEAVARFPLKDPSLQKKSLSPRSLQISREMDFFKSRYFMLGPSMLIMTHREAFIAKEDRDVRVTFDNGITWRNTALDFEHGDGGNDLLACGQRVMEIKCAGAYPLWLVDVLNESRIYPVSFSKYGRAYQASTEKKPAYAEPRPVVMDQTTAHMKRDYVSREGVYCA